MLGKNRPLGDRVQSTKLDVLYIIKDDMSRDLDSDLLLRHLEAYDAAGEISLKIDSLYDETASPDILVVPTHTLVKEGRKRPNAVFVIMIEDETSMADGADRKGDMLLPLADDILTADMLSNPLIRKTCDHIIARVRLAKFERQALETLSSSPDALISIDKFGYITFVSPHYHRRYPGSIDVLYPGAHILEAMERVSEESRMLDHFGTMQELRNWWENPVGAKEFKLANGIWLRLHARKMDNGGTVITTMNITDYKKQQALLFAKSAQLAVSTEKERHLLEQQRQFVSMVSHEFKTPLTIIDGNAQIIERRGDELSSEKRTQRARNVRESVSRLVQLIERILSIHTLETGKFDIQPDHFDFSTMLQSVVEEYKEYGGKHRIDLVIRALPRTVYLDQKVMRQVVSNLIGNAIKYSPQADSIEVNAVSNGGHLLLEVRDYGVGIPKDEINRIFDRYFRASTATGISGSGLGLNLVKDFVELHGGSIVIESEIGQGTVVSVTLPIMESGAINHVLTNLT